MDHYYDTFNVLLCNFWSFTASVLIYFYCMYKNKIKKKANKPSSKTFLLILCSIKERHMGLKKT